ncbi:hypothetical protein [Actinophytocola sp.]|uniref:hypothetical protein n=1 Tax=Actinophytocola sp. TaxID=1872138 RepID=UPI002ED0EFC9
MSIIVVAVERLWRGGTIRRNDQALVDKDPIAAWEHAYRAYENAAETDVASTSRAVAAAWRGLTESTDLPWWLLAAVCTAAEAFDHQAEAWEDVPSRPPTTDNTKKPPRKRYVWPAVLLPTARRPTNGWQVLADTTPNGSDNGETRSDSTGEN